MQWEKLTLRSVADEHNWHAFFIPTLLQFLQTPFLLSVLFLVLCSTSIAMG